MPTDEVSEPTIVQKRAIDVTPHEHGIWCSIGDGQPFVNTIVLRRWYDDGTKISFMLDSHNFASAEPEELMSVVEIEYPYSAEHLADCLQKDAEKMAKRPVITDSEKALTLALKSLPKDVRERIARNANVG